MELESLAASPPMATVMADYFMTLRRREYGRLDAADHAYLDYTGAGLYAASQIEAHQRGLEHEVLGNPHSENPASAASTERLERARLRVLRFLRADPAVHDVVFTANASAALRLVAESFPFGPGSRFVLTADNHNSVNGIRCYAERAGAQVGYVPLDATLRAMEPGARLKPAAIGSPHLFAYPAQSNYSGVRHPLGWIANAADHGYRVLLDAAAYVPTAELRLDEIRPDFVCVSFYKMFGFPTGIGALVARRDALAMLRRPWFAGGTVDWVSTQHTGHALRPGAEAFEDGTPHFLAARAVCDGLDLLDRIGMSRIEAHVRDMTAQLIAGLLTLRHADGRPVIDVHGPCDMAGRGGTVAFNVKDAAGTVVPFDDVVARAGRSRVSVRGGCFCNPGCAEAALGMDAERARICRSTRPGRFTPARFAACMGGPIGAVRASVGVATTAADIDRLLAVLESYRNRAS